MVEKFWEKVKKTDTCWLWQSGVNQAGYGRFWIKNKGAVMAHRFSYELVKGKIPAIKCLDHLCRIHNCVNPDHLEVVSVRENIMRGIGITAVNARKTECKRGHPLDSDNVYCYRSTRQCKQCRVAIRRRHYYKYFDSHPLKKSPHTGIYYERPGKRWTVRLSTGDRKYIGNYATHKEAVKALKKMKK